MYHYFHYHRYNDDDEVQVFFLSYQTMGDLNSASETGSHITNRRELINFLFIGCVKMSLYVCMATGKIF